MNLFLLIKRKPHTFTSYVDMWEVNKKVSVNYCYTQQQNVIDILFTKQTVAKSLDDMLALNASVNMYMFHGGTSFGLKAGERLRQSYVRLKHCVYYLIINGKYLNIGLLKR